MVHIKCSVRVSCKPSGWVLFDCWSGRFRSVTCGCSPYPERKFCLNPLAVWRGRRGAGERAQSRGSSSSLPLEKDCVMKRRNWNPNLLSPCPVFSPPLQAAAGLELTVMVCVLYGVRPTPGASRDFWGALFPHVPAMCDCHTASR